MTKPRRTHIVATLLKLIWQLDKAYYPVLLLVGLSQAASNLLLVYMPHILIEGFEAGRGAGDTSGAVRFTLIIATFLLARYLLLQLTALLKRHEQIHQARLERSLPIAFAEKVMRIDYANLEDPEILDLKERALFPVTNYGALSGLFMSLIRVVTAVFTLAGVTLMLLQFSVLFTLVILVLSLVGLVFNARFMARFKEIADSIIPVNRRYSYYADTATRPDAQKEYRLYNMSDMMNRKISGYTQEINDWLRDIYLTQGDTESGQAVMSAISSFLTYVYVALRVLTDRFGPQIGLAEFSVIVLATQSFARSFREAYVSLYQVIQNIGFLEPFAQFIDLPETAAQLGELQDPGRFETLSFERVSFAYPGTDRVILEEVSFDLHAGETISIVGLNNAGKSTLVKLICRLFEPSSGRILWNGTDIRDLDHQAYMDSLSCVFQDFQLFPFSIRDNIAVGDTEPTDETVSEVLDRVSIGGYIRDLPRQLDTHLDKALYEDATDLSGGQKQKLAIARAVYKQAELVILDEPTAALDPLAEAEVYEHFHELTQDRTAIFISHRMSSSVFCDRILLLQDGRVAAYDSHRKLMRSTNLYRELFETQAANYR